MNNMKLSIEKNYDVFFENPIDRERKTNCIYCYEEFTFTGNDLDENCWITCPHCDGKHETKGFVNWEE